MVPAGAKTTWHGSFAGVVGSSFYATPELRVSLPQGETVNVYGYDMSFSDWKTNEQGRGVLEAMLYVVHEVEQHEGEDEAPGRVRRELVGDERGDAGEGGDERAAEEELAAEEDQADPGVGEGLADAALAAEEGAHLARGEESREQGDEDARGDEGEVGHGGGTLAQGDVWSVI